MKNKSIMAYLRRGVKATLITCAYSNIFSSREKSKWLLRKCEMWNKRCCVHSRSHCTFLPAQWDITWPHMLCFWFRPCWHRPCFFPRTESLSEHTESEQNEQNTLSAMPLALFSSARVPSLRWAEHQPLSFSLSGWLVCFKLRLQCLPPLQLRQTQSERRARVHTRIIHQSLRRGAQHTTRDVNNTHAL
jgi:hypothetical protein